MWAKGAGPSNDLGGPRDTATTGGLPKGGLTCNQGRFIKKAWPSKVKWARGWYGPLNGRFADVKCEFATVSFRHSH